MSAAAARGLPITGMAESFDCTCARISAFLALCSWVKIATWPSGSTMFTGLLRA